MKETLLEVFKRENVRILTSEFDGDDFKIVLDGGELNYIRARRFIEKWRWTLEVGGYKCGYFYVEGNFGNPKTVNLDPVKESKKQNVRYLLRVMKLILNKKRREARQPAPPKDIPTLAEAEKELIKRALEYSKGNRTQAAKILGMSLRTLRNKIVSYANSGDDYFTVKHEETFYNSRDPRRKDEREI